MKTPSDLRRGDKAELDAMLRCRGFVLMRSRIESVLDAERNLLETKGDQTHAEMEGRRRYILALRHVLDMPAAIIREYENERDAGVFGKQGED